MSADEPSRRGAHGVGGLLLLGAAVLMTAWSASRTSRPAAMANSAAVPPGSGAGRIERSRDAGGSAPGRGDDTAPGEHGERVGSASLSYIIGLALAGLLTAASFYASETHLIYGPGVPFALTVLAIAQMGVHLVFFLHMTTSPDNINNAMALAFGVLIVTLLVGGTVWIMMHLNGMMPPHMGPMAPNMGNMDMGP